METGSEVCPFCSADLGFDADLNNCPECGTSHHLDCWDENGGCAVVGCGTPQAAAKKKLPKIKNSRALDEGVPSAYRGPLPGASRGSVFPWIALLLVGMGLVIAVTRLVVDGEDQELERSPVPAASSPSGQPSKASEGPVESARQILTREGYEDCGVRAFRRGNTSETLCLAVARAVRVSPRAGIVTGIFSDPNDGGTGYDYDLECRSGNAEKVLQMFRFCTEIATNDPKGISNGGIAEVVVRP